MKKVLVYPCGTEIALEIHRSLRYAKGYELIGGIDNYDHGQFVFRKCIKGLPMIRDNSGYDEIMKFESAVKNYGVDFIYPAMDAVIAVFAKFRNAFRETLIVSDASELCRSKKKIYSILKNIIGIPKIYNSPGDVKIFPVFIKPDKGQGSSGARKINTPEELNGVDFERFVVMEYLPGKEYTVDCFTNSEGKLIYSKGRGRRRIKNGISVNAIFVDRTEFTAIAEKINGALNQKGGWFFQLREDKNGDLKLLEVAARIAGTSAISRNIGANLPLMTLDIFNGVKINDVVLNEYSIELDRALENVYRTDIKYSTVYIDYDDTVVKNGIINTSVIRFLYQCLNREKKLILISRHSGNLYDELKKYRLNSLFDKVIHIHEQQQKTDYITDQNSIFIDDSYGERKAVKNATGIPVFDTHMIECLQEA